MKILHTINRGGFGRVQKAELLDGTIVARKEFSPGHEALARADIEKLRARFVREVKVQTHLPKEYFLPVIESDLKAEVPWFTMPLAERNLEQQIGADRRARVPISREPLADVLNALEELHSLGYVHRDLKPQNILLVDGVWKLADLGLVLPIGNVTTKLTSVASTWGTPQYCAPEQVQDFGKCTYLADIYAFGCILHDIFAGRSRVPYQQQSCDGPVGWIIEKCTEISPHKRFKSIAALRGALFSALAQQANPNTSPEAQEWVCALQVESNWTLSRLEELVRFLHAFADNDQKGQICFALDEERIRALHGLDEDLWAIIAKQYCTWAQGSFEFEYCDVLIRRLELIFELGTYECKAAAAIAAARLGESHNRWFVMRRLLNMCGPKMDERLATRVGIEIRAEEAEVTFVECARRIERDISSFHPQIVAALNEFVDLAA